MLTRFPNFGFCEFRLIHLGLYIFLSCGLNDTSYILLINFKCSFLTQQELSKLPHVNFKYYNDLNFNAHALILLNFPKNMPNWHAFFLHEKSIKAKISPFMIVSIHQIYVLYGAECNMN